MANLEARSVSLKKENENFWSSKIVLIILKFEEENTLSIFFLGKYSGQMTK